VYPHGASFYGHTGNASSMYPGGLWDTPRPGAHFCGRPDNAYSASPNGVQHLSPDASTMEVNKVLLEQQQTVGSQPMENRGPTSGKSVVQFCESVTPGSTIVQSETGSRQNTTVKTSAEQTPMNETTELEAAGTVYHTAQTKRDDSSDRREPATEPELRTKERKVLQYDSDDSEDMSDVRRHRKEKTGTDTKASSTRHSSRQLNGASKQASDPADAKVGSTQHSQPKKSNSTSQNRTADRTGRHKKRLSTSPSRSTSAEGRKREQRKRSSPRETRREDDSEDASLGSSSEEESVAAPKHIIKPPKFDGQGSFETFMAQFSNCAEHKWNESQKLAYLCSVLDKEAAYVLWDYGQDVIRTLPGLMTILETRFGGKAMSDKHRIEIRNRRRKADETLQSVHSDIRRLAALAYPNVPPEMREEVT